MGCPLTVEDATTRPTAATTADGVAARRASARLAATAGATRARHTDCRMVTGVEDRSTRGGRGACCFGAGRFLGELRETDVFEFPTPLPRLLAQLAPEPFKKRLASSPPPPLVAAVASAAAAAHTTALTADAAVRVVAIGVVPVSWLARCRSSGRRGPVPTPCTPTATAADYAYRHPATSSS